MKSNVVFFFLFFFQIGLVVKCRKQFRDFFGYARRKLISHPSVTDHAGSIIFTGFRSKKSPGLLIFHWVFLLSSLKEVAENRGSLNRPSLGRLNYTTGQGFSGSIRIQRVSFPWLSDKPKMSCDTCFNL